MWRITLMIGVALAHLTGAAQALDYRAEITRELIDPCIRAILKHQGGVPSVADAEAVALVKILTSDQWERMIEAWVPMVSGKSVAQRQAVYKIALPVCVKSATGG